jgi:hypothetical protein
MDSRKLYNNGRWPSPSAVRFCKESGLDKNHIPKKDSIGRNKKLTHLEALNLIASKCKISIEDLLTLEKRDVIQKLSIRSFIDSYKNLRCYQTYH